MTHGETELQIRLRRANEALAYAKQKEDEARKALRSAEDSRRAAKARRDELFLAVEQEEYQCRRRAAE